MAVTNNMAITLLEQAQAQKEVTANAAITDLDQFTGKLSKSIAAGGTINLTTDEAQNGLIELTGAPASATTVVVPTGVAKWTIFVNRQTNTQTVQVRMTATGTLFTLPRGNAAILYGTAANQFVTVLGHEVQEEGTTVGTRSRLNFVSPIITAADDGANDRVNVTLATAAAVGLADANAEGVATTGARSDHTHKRDVKVREEGGAVGTRNALNFVSPIITATDDAGNDEVDVTLATAAPVALGTTAAEGAATTGVRSDHVHPRDAVPLCFNAATVTWTDQPAGSTEFLGLNDRRRKYDLTSFTQVRLQTNVEVAGAAAASLKAEYSTDQTTWNDLEDGGGTGPTTLIDATGLIVSSYVTIPAGAKADVFLRIVGVGGDGAADPQLGLVELQAK